MLYPSHAVNLLLGCRRRSPNLLKNPLKDYSLRPNFCSHVWPNRQSLASFMGLLQVFVVCDALPCRLKIVSSRRIQSGQGHSSYSQYCG